MKRIIVVYLAGLMQGLALVTFPSASVIFTSSAEFNFSNAGYGGLFIPQAILSIVASFLSAKLAARKGIKQVFLLGLLSNLVAMLLLASSTLVMKTPSAYPLLLLATASLGFGFGLTVPSLNMLAAFLFPKKIGRSILILNALLGLGTALAPVLIAAFTGLGIWWGLPLCVAIGLFILTSMGFSLDFNEYKVDNTHHREKSLPPTFWLFASFILLYGMIETVNGNWASIYMQKNLHASEKMASLALTSFWAMVTIGRLLFAWISQFLAEKWIFRLLPFIIAAAFIFFAMPSQASDIRGVFLFGLAGLGCSALLPLTMSFADKALPSLIACITGKLIAFYLIGYGIAAFGIGALQDRAQIQLPFIFAIACAAALILGGLSFAITSTKKEKLKMISK